MRPRLVLFALLLAAAPAARGQTGVASPGLRGQTSAATLRVNVLRPLEFGPLIGGVDAALRPTDGRATAEFEILGPPGATVQLVFALPNALAGENAGRVDITFGGQSAAYSVSQSNLDMIAFDPRAPFSLRLPASGRVVVLIGGTAHASRQLVSGKYASSLSLSVTMQ
jgi:hypothetical protein